MIVLAALVVQSKFGLVKLGGKAERILILATIVMAIGFGIIQFAK
jgi:hypothetical protein